MSKRRKRKKEDGHINESWLLPYADLLTLLLALFIVLFAASSIDDAKFGQISAAFSQVFSGGTGVLDQNAPTAVPVTKPTKGDEITNNESSAYLEDQRSLEEIQGKLDGYIAVHELEAQFETQLTDEGLLVTIRDSILFESGKATISSEYENLASDIADLLVFETPRQIVITGHTDNIPIHTNEFGSNWQLSVMRAVNFLNILVKNEEIDPKMFSVKGYGEFQPIADNSTVEGRSKNRRVEVLIQPLVLEDGARVPN